MTIEYFTKNKKKIAYSASASGAFTLVFLGGFMSDMMGSKATHLEDWAKNNHCGFLRFDYSVMVKVPVSLKVVTSVIG